MAIRFEKTTYLGNVKAQQFHSQVRSAGNVVSSMDFGLESDDRTLFGHRKLRTGRITDIQPGLEFGHFKTAGCGQFPSQIPPSHNPLT